MNTLRSLGLLAAVGAATVLTGCVAPGPYYGDVGYSQPYYAEPAPVVVGPPVVLGIGVDSGPHYYRGRPGYYGPGYGPRPGYYGRGGYAPRPGYVPRPGFVPGPGAGRPVPAVPSPRFGGRPNLGDGSRQQRPDGP